ncbi:hypothetical protein ANO14919_120040 [Xylariales sp. No.14919]|nr:hypothetical protein ANO14919_120040 [Xylariales sp. No.14919]
MRNRWVTPWVDPEGRELGNFDATAAGLAGRFYTSLATKQTMRLESAGFSALL